MAPLFALASEAIGAQSGQALLGRRMSRGADQSFNGLGLPALFGDISEPPPTPIGAHCWWWHTPHDLLENIDEANQVRDTRFRVRLNLPIVEAPADGPKHTPDVMIAWDAVRERLGRIPRVLFAEDNSTNQFVARQMLKTLDIHLDMVANGAEAVEAASRFAYDVICMDMQMPEMDGVAATRMIRSRGGSLASVPIIALTANALPEDMRACFDAGMNQFLAKPVNRKDLLAALLTALDNATPDAAPSQVREAMANT
jgi:CheY-like chemotaxis protein